MKKAVLIYLTLISFGCSQNKNASPSENTPKPSSEARKQAKNNPKKLDKVTNPNSETSEKSTTGTPFPQLLRELKFHKEDSENIKYTDFSAKNNLLVTVSEEPCEAPCSKDQHQVNVYNLNSGAEELYPMATFRHFTPDTFLPYLDDWRHSWKPIISSDEKFIVTRKHDDEVIVSSLVEGSGHRGWSFKMQKNERYSATAVSLSDDNKRLAIGFTRYDAEKRRSYTFINVFEMDSGLLSAEFYNEGGVYDTKIGLEANSLYFSPDGNFLTAGYSSHCSHFSMDRVIEVYSIKNKNTLKLPSTNGCPPSSDFFDKSMFSEDSKTISIFYGLSTMQVDLESQKILSKFDEKTTFAWDEYIQLSPNRRFKIVKKFGTGCGS